MLMHAEEQRVTPFEGMQFGLSFEGRDSTLCFDKVIIGLIIFIHCGGGELRSRHHFHLVILFDISPALFKHLYEAFWLSADFIVNVENLACFSGYDASRQFGAALDIEEILVRWCVVGKFRPVFSNRVLFLRLHNSLLCIVIGLQGT